MSWAERLGAKVFGGLPAQNTKSCIEDMTKARTLYEARGIRRRGLYIVLAACYKLDGKLDAARDACKIFGEIPKISITDNLDDDEVKQTCSKLK